MTASESDTAADPSHRGPGFPVADWGYERGLVDARVAELGQQLAAARRRGDQAERALSALGLDLPARHGQGPGGAVEADPAGLLEWAGVVAAGVLAEAGRRVEATILAAGVKAAARLRTAAERAGSLEQEARQLLVEAEGERVRIRVAATRRAEQVRAGADREARALIAKARGDAEVAWEAAVRERRRVAAQAEALATHRQRMVEQLGRLYGPLGLLVVDADEHDRGGRSGAGLPSEDQPWVTS